MVLILNYIKHLKKPTNINPSHTILKNWSEGNDSKFFSNIILRPKSDKLTTKLKENYKPVSLMDINTKMLIKILGSEFIPQ